jgi:hypothetical protein
MGIGFSAFAVTLVSAALAEGVSATRGGLEGEEEEEDELRDESPAGSAAAVVQASARAKANGVIREEGFKFIPLFEVN